VGGDIKQCVAGHGCPRCALARRAASRRRVSRERSLAVLDPALAEELHVTRNGDLDPSALGVGTRREVWWS